MEENQVATDSSAPNSPELTRLSGEQAEERTARGGRKFAYVGRNGIWPNTVTCRSHVNRERMDRLCRIMLALNTTAVFKHVETELPCLLCTDEVASGVE